MAMLAVVVAAIMAIAGYAYRGIPSTFRFNPFLLSSPMPSTIQEK